MFKIIKISALFLSIAIQSQNIRAQQTTEIASDVRYPIVERITDRVYACVKSGKVHFLDHKGNDIGSEGFDAYAFLRKHNLIVTFSTGNGGAKKNKFRLIYCASATASDFSEFFDGFIGLVSGKLYLTRDGTTFSVDAKGQVKEITGLKKGDRIKAGMGSFETYIKRSDSLSKGIGLTSISNYQGRVIVERRAVEEKANGHPDSKQGIFDLAENRWILEPRLEEIGRLGPDPILVSRSANEKEVYIDYNGRTLIDGAEYETCGNFSEGLAPVKKNGEWQFIDRDGKVALSGLGLDDDLNDYDLQFKNGMCVVKKQGKYGLLARDGRFLIDPVYDQLAPVNTSEQESDDESVDGSSGFVYAPELQSYLFWYKKEGRYGAINSKNKVIVSGKQSEIGYRSPYLSWSEDNNKLFFLHLQTGKEHKIATPDLYDYNTERGLLAVAENSGTTIKSFEDKVLYRADSMIMMIPYKNLFWLQKNRIWELSASQYLNTPEIELVEAKVVQGIQKKLHISAKFRCLAAMDSARLYVEGHIYPIAPSEISGTGIRGEYKVIKNVDIEGTDPSGTFFSLKVANAIGESSLSRLLGPSDQPPLSRGSQKKGLAILIGNRDYSAIELSFLSSPVRDVLAMKSALEKLEYETICDTNLDRRSIDLRLAEYRQRASGYEKIVVYYSGHGISSLGTQYIVPTDIASDLDPRTAMFRLDRLSELRSNERQQILVISDACRVAQHVTTAEQKYNQEPIEKHNDPKTIYWFSSTDGGTASDYSPDGSNSLFTGVLLRYIGAPGLKLSELYKYVNITMQGDYPLYNEGQASEISSRYDGTFRIGW